MSVASVVDNALFICLPGQTPSKKSSQRILVNKRTNRPFIMMNEKAKAWEDEAVRLLKEALKNRGIKQWLAHHSNERLFVWMSFTRQSKRRWDYINLAQSVLDVLVKAGIIKDDDFQHVIPEFDPFVRYSKDRPEVLIKLYK